MQKKNLGEIPDFFNRGITLTEILNSGNTFDPTIKTNIMKQLVTILFLTSFLPSIWAQEVISSGGDSFNNGNIQLDCT
ncbi:MAG: hypothetical protein ACI9EV_003065, partial [Urechidicola sp.]